MSKLSIVPIAQSRSCQRPWTPRKYQLAAVRQLISQAGSGLFLDPGLGKTSSTLAAFALLQKEHLARRALVIAPLRVCYEVWPREVTKWKDFSHLRVEVLHGPGKDEALRRPADLYAINPEGLSWLVKKRRFTTLAPDVLIVDESTKFKTWKSARVRLLRPLLRLFRRRWILTGTPLPNGLEDLFAQAYIMDMGRALGIYKSAYLRRWFVPAERGWVPVEGAEAEINAALAPYVLRLKAEDHLQLPRRIDNVIRVELPPEARAVYDRVENEFFAEVSGHSVLAVSEAAKGTKLRQIANGAVYASDEPDVEATFPQRRARVWMPVHDAKLDALEDLVEQLQGAPLLVAYEFAHDRDRILERLGPCPVLGSGMKPAALHKLVDDWNDGKIPILLGHPAAMGHGLNMQEKCRNVALFSMFWDLELVDQYIKRVLRQGNDAPDVRVHWFVASKTIDIVIRQALRAKDVRQSRFLDALDQYRRGMLEDDE